MTRTFPSLQRQLALSTEGGRSRCVGPLTLGEQGLLVPMGDQVVQCRRRWAARPEPAFPARSYLCRWQHSATLRPAETAVQLPAGRTPRGGGRNPICRVPH